MDLNKPNKESKIKINLSKSSIEEKTEANSNSNISENLTKKSFNLSKSNSGENSIPVITKHGDSKEKELPKSNTKKKWWIWILLAIILIAAVFFIKNLTSKNTDKSLIAKTEQVTTKANEVIADMQNGSVNFEETKAKVEKAQKEVDEAKAAAKTDEEKQAVADAQAKVDEAVKAVETSKQAAKPLGTDKTAAPEESEGVASTTPVETSTEKDVTNHKPIATTTTTQGSQSSSKKPSTNTSSQSNVPDGTLEGKARQVIRGDFGNGMDRKNALGSEYNAIQSKVNEIYLNNNVR